MSSWLTRTAGTAARNGTTTQTLTFPAATAGSLLVAVAAAGATFTWGGSWLARETPVGSVQVAVATLTAAGGETGVTLTLNAANYPVQWIVYEFAAGSAWVASANDTSSVNPPALTGLTGTTAVFSAASRGVGAGGGLLTAAWDAPFIGDLDAWTGFATTDGAYLTVAVVEGNTAATVTPTLAITPTPPTGENVTFAVRPAAAAPTAQFVLSRRVTLG